MRECSAFARGICPTFDATSDVRTPRNLSLRPLRATLILASPGFPVEGWAASETVALETTDGAIFYMDPGSGPASDGAMLFAQLTLADETVAAGGTATAGLQGRSVQGDDWGEYAVAWAW